MKREDLSPWIRYIDKLRSTYLIGDSFRGIADGHLNVL